MTDPLDWHAVPELIAADIHRDGAATIDRRGHYRIQIVHLSRDPHVRHDWQIDDAIGSETGHRKRRRSAVRARVDVHRDDRLGLVARVILGGDGDDVTRKGQYRESWDVDLRAVSVPIARAVDPLDQ